MIQATFEFDVVGPVSDIVPRCGPAKFAQGTAQGNGGWVKESKDVSPRS